MFKYLKMPYVPLALFATLVWFGGSTYWYVCETQGLCEEQEVAVVEEVQEAEPAEEAAVEPAPEPEPVVAVTAPDQSVVFFQADSTDPVDASWEDGLDGLVDYMAADANVTVTVASYAANVVSDVDGSELSDNRADFVAQYLIGTGVDASRIQTESRVFENQIGDNYTEEDIAKNRRVTVDVN